MSSQRDRMRTNLEGDRISSLPDDLIAQILSLIGTKQAVETGVLSSRWRFIWTRIPHLNFSSKDFSTLKMFNNFFTHVTSYCNNQQEMSLNLRGKGSQELVQRILSHACSHNLQQLTFKFLHENRFEFPFSVFSSRCLKHLTLIGYSGTDWIIPTSMWELPALTTLHLEKITLYDHVTDNFVALTSNCTNLKNLIIISCAIGGWNGFTICHPQLSSLTLKNYWCQKVANVVAPKLKNLTIKSWDGELRISAADLTSLFYENCRFQLSLDIDSFISLETVGLCISNPHNAGDAHRVVNLLQKFSHVKFLTLSMETIELLSSSVEAIARQPFPFVKLRSLKIYPVLLNEQHNRELTMSTEIKNYLLDSSPQATFTIVTHEEIRVERDTKSAQNLITELRVLLDLENARKEKKEQHKRPKPYWKRMPINTRKRMTHDWDDLDEEIEQGKEKINDIISLVRLIKELLIKLPTSNKAKFLTDLSTLCTEADTVIGKILNRMKTKLETKEGIISVCLNQLFAAAQSSP